ncbi:hydroxymethylglutaryl-CoA lyase [Telmatospirillum sp. J64-1]|uniref:hydroxymethylglutaryl-CoA lyase n=1 Tax=Telmatospirillum sp. J64-1 TaxID=2502183 RepID=UPI00115C684F|nr:hydroxymethylglutaryl-CoA lyase [Telmatospirillum sp. J64-1]
MRPQRVKIVEVGPRDGLQNEAQPISVPTRIELIERLAAAGLRNIEAGSFVSPKWVPQMAGTAEVLAGLEHRPGVSYSVLVPNMRGLEAALAAGAEEVAVFAAASESFSRRNINCSIAESLDRFAPVVAAAREKGLRVRGYLSCVLGCPYEGAIDPKKVAGLAAQLAEMGCGEISLGDTIGVGTADQVRRLIAAQSVAKDRLAMHFHDTYGQAVANILVSLEEGIATFDSSVAGLGGCPYAAGATGNVATEDVVYLLHGLGIETGIDLRVLAETGAWISARLGRANASRVGRAMEKNGAGG